MSSLKSILNYSCPTNQAVLSYLARADPLSGQDHRESNLSSIETGSILTTQHYAELFSAALELHLTVFLYPNGEF